MRPSAALALGIGSAIVAAVACGGGGQTSSGFAPGGDGGGHDSALGPAGGDSGSFGGDDGPPSFGDAGTIVHDAAPPQPVAVVYAHSAGTLYRLTPTNDQVAVVGPFKGCSQVIDIAIDSSSNGYVTTFGGFYSLDLKTAACTQIASGSYPNSLSFVPKGTLDPNSEALVGYVGSEYVRIDTKTGVVSKVGGLSANYQSSGDIVSVIGGGTFLTVTGGPMSCGDCLLQIDPKTGDLVQNYGSIKHSQVFGLAFWAGTAYGFDNGGQVFSIGWQNGALVTTNIAVPNPPPGLEFWGAGSTTAAPPTTADGGGIPIQ